MSSTTTTTASDVAGVWFFGKLSAAIRGKKRQAVPTVSHADHQHQMGGAAHGNKAAAAAKPSVVDRKEAGGGGMSDATVYLLLDRFAPS
ncbi:hypothetical protein CFC21_070155 [Triticum aestivum]|uniref:Uncharacterized protein n=2 Tax=Triticum aestivum TaxID=4565 RepID=A0A3B6LGQ1_WHEAT|nr:hypothetical protein CFC21_070155 [Triticum aestivum]